jgi:hypothetical protein
LFFMFLWFGCACERSHPVSPDAWMHPLRSFGRESLPNGVCLGDCWLEAPWWLPGGKAKIKFVPKQQKKTTAGLLIGYWRQEPAQPEAPWEPHLVRILHQMVSPGCLQAPRGGQCFFFSFSGQTLFWPFLQVATKEAPANSQPGRSHLVRILCQRGSKCTSRSVERHGLSNHRHYKNTQNVRRTNLEPHLHQWDGYDPVAHKRA